MLDKFRETAITWDKANRKIYEPLRASAGDNKGRKLSVQVVNGGVIENLSGASLSLYWETKDKAHNGLDAFETVDAAKGEFEIYYKTGMLSNEGTLNANLVLVDTSGRVVSEPFTITVFKGIDDDAIQSSDSFTALTEALIDISNLEQNYAPRLSTLEQNDVSLSQQLQQITLIATEHGVIGDGLTNDTDNIINVFNMLNAMGGGTVLFPDTGQPYVVNQDVNVTLNPNVDIEVVGHNVEFKRTQNNAGNLFLFKPVSAKQKNKVSIKGIILNGIGVEEQWDLTDYTQLKQVRGVTSEVTDFIFEQSSIINCYGFGLRCLQFDNVLINHNKMNNVGGSWYQIHDFDAFGDAIYLIPKNTDSEAVINHNKLVGYNSVRPRLSRIGVTIEYKGCKVNMYDNTIIGYQRTIHVEGAIETKLTVDNLTTSRYNLFLFLMNGAVELTFNNVHLSEYEGTGRTDFGGYKGVFSFYEVTDPPLLTTFNNCIFNLNTNSNSVGNHVVFNNCQFINHTNENLVLSFVNSNAITLKNCLVSKMRTNINTCTNTDLFGSEFIGKLPELTALNIVSGNVKRFENLLIQDGIFGFENTDVTPINVRFVKKIVAEGLNVFIRPYGKTYNMFGCLFESVDSIAVVSSSYPKPNYLNCFRIINGVPTVLS